MGFLIIVKSITYAQRALGILSRNGISSNIIKPPVSLGKGSCSYALKIKEINPEKAVSVLKSSNIPISGVFAINGGNYKEVNV